MDRQDMVDTASELTEQSKGVNMVLIDDDPVFCSLMVEYARRISVNLHCYHDLLQVQESGNLQHYHVAILDYQLEHMNGLEVAQWIPMFFNDMPIVLVSYEDRTAENTQLPWPGSVSCFIHKRRGVHTILKKAIELGSQNKNAECLKIQPNKSVVEPRAI